MKNVTRMLSAGAIVLTLAAFGQAVEFGTPRELPSDFKAVPEILEAPAITPPAPAELERVPTADDAVTRRLAEMEAEQEALRAELKWLRENRPSTIRLPEVKATPIGLHNEIVVPETPVAEEEYFTLDELKTEMKKLAWRKGEFSIVPYGALWGSGIYSTERVYPGAYTLWVESPDDQGEDTFTIDTRRTRIGMNIGGPRIPLFGNAKSGGKVEIDFHGAFVIENKPGILLRHAYGEVKNERFRLLAGQTWDLISPLYPSTISYTVGWAGGNIGYRRAQVRMERYLAFSDKFLLTLAGSANQNIVSDFNGTGAVNPESSGWPLFEFRSAVTWGRRNCPIKPITIGVSGHIGEQGADFLTTGPAPYFLPPRDDYRIRTWSMNVDVYVPITERFGMKGEFFTGENLGTFLGGIVQGVNLRSRRGIRSTGGWFDFWYDVTPRLHAHAGFGIDDPVNSDLMGSGRSYNEFLFVNSTFNVTKNLEVGAEVSSWKTHFIDKRPGESVQFEFTGKYGF